MSDPPKVAAPLKFARRMPITIRVNGSDVASEVPARTTLLDWLRETVGLTGTKKGCNEGACGACTALVDGRRMNGCLTLAAQCDGRDVVTIEGLAASDGHCIRSSARSPSMTPSSVATARPGRSCRRSRASPRDMQVMRTRSESG